MQSPPQAPIAAARASELATPRSTLVVAISALFALGIVNGALGPLLPRLSDQVGQPVEELGAIFAALFLGALILQVAGGWLNERVGLRRMMAAGCGLLAAAVLGLSVSPTLPALLGCALLAGAGQGALDASTNVLVPAVFGERSVSAVNLLHFAFGAGAVLSPVMISVAASAAGSPMPVLWVAAALGTVTALTASRWAMDPKVARPHPAGPAAGLRIYARPALWLLSLLLFLGVGVEIGTGGWTTVYAERTTSLGDGAVSMLVSGFWLALMSGRLLGAALGVRTTSRRLAMLAIGTTCVGSAMLVLGSGSAGWTVAGTLVTGLGVGPIFPTTVVLATELFAAAPSRAVSMVIAVSSVGGMLLPPFQGLLLQRVAPLASAGLVAAECVAMMLLVVAVEAAARRARAPSSSGGSD
jgi:fucose permease